jgi:hypothetical protein
VATLHTEALYFGDNGRILCSALACAGSTALHTGRDLSGTKVQRVSIDDVVAWSTDIGPMVCDCGAVTLTTTASPDGWPTPKGNS